MTGASTRSALLLERNEAVLARSAQRPLLRRMAGGTITEDEFAAYRVIEERFVRAVARVLGFCIWQEDDWDVVLHHAASLAGLVGEQSDQLGRRLSGPAPDGAGSGALITVVDDAVRSGGYPAVVTCLCAAETLYGRWCGAAAARAGGTVPGPAGEWIDLHVSDEFTAQVAFLQTLVDRMDPAVVPDEVLDLWFRRMLEAEDIFHDSALADRPADQPAPIEGHVDD